MEMFIYEVDGDRTNIYITEFDDVKELNDKLADFICSFKDQKDPNTNINSFQTPWLIGSPETEIILSKVAECYELPIEEVSEIIYDNSKAIFKDDK